MNSRNTRAVVHPVHTSGLIPRTPRAPVQIQWTEPPSKRGCIQFQHILFFTLIALYFVFKWSQVRNEMRDTILQVESGKCDGQTTNGKLGEACKEMLMWYKMSTAELMIDAMRRDLPLLKESAEWLLDVLFFKDLIRAVIVIFALAAGMVGFVFFKLFMVTAHNTQESARAATMTTRQLIGALQQRASDKRH